jgi:hypothetical protein
MNLCKLSHAPMRILTCFDNDTKVGRISWHFWHLQPTQTQDEHLHADSFDETSTGGNPPCRTKLDEYRRFGGLVLRHESVILLIGPQSLNPDLWQLHLGLWLRLHSAV